MFYAYDVNKYIITHNTSITVEDAAQMSSVAYVSIPLTSTGYGATNIEYSNNACIVEDFPGVIPGSWDRDALAPVDMLTDSDGEPSELAEVMENLTTAVIYDQDDYQERDLNSQLEHLRQLDPTVSEAQWLAAGNATDWRYWPGCEGDGTYYYIPEDEYAILRAAVI